MTQFGFKEKWMPWVVLGLLFAGSVINYMDRMVLSVVMPRVRSDLSLSNVDYGLAVNAFLIPYMTFYILGGRLADRFGCRRTFSVAITIWSIASMLHAFSQGLKSLCVFRALLGMGEGAFYPTAMRGIVEWFRAEDRAKAVALVLGGTSIGGFLTPPVVAWLTLRYGWRASFFVTGALGFLLLGCWVSLQRRIRGLYGSLDPAPASHSSGGVDSPVEGAISLREALARRKYWLLLGARAAADGAWFFYLFWMPGYFQEVRGFSLVMVGNLLWIPYFCGDVGGIAGAWASSRLIEKGYGLDFGRKAVLLFSASLALLGTFAYYVPADLLSLGLISVAIMGAMSWGTNIHTVIIDAAPKQHVAVLYGITGAAGTFLGAISQPVIGSLVESFGYELPFCGAGLAYVLAVCLMLGAGRIDSGIRSPQSNGSVTVHA